MIFQFKTIAAAACVGLGLAGCVENTGGGGQTAVIVANKNVVIQNNTGRTIWRFYGSPVNVNSWEEDILGNSVLSAGEAVNVDFADGRTICNYDMRAEFRDGTGIVKNNINVCTVSRVSFP